MQLAFAGAFLGGLGLFVGDPTLPVAARVAAEGVAWLLCSRGNPYVAPFGVLAAGLLALTSHATDAGARFADVLHVLSAAMWGGGILALVTLRPPEGWRSAEARLLIERFGRVAIIAFGITALTGFLRATEQLGEVSQLWTTTYGGVLALKVAAVLLLVGVSAAWRRGLAPTWLEAAVAVLIVLLTAVVATTPPPPIPPVAVIG
jgi:putative copper export protein